MSFRLAALAILLSSFSIPSQSAIVAEKPQEVARGAYPDIAAGVDGSLHLAYVRDGRLYYRRHASESWSAEEATGLEAGLVQRSDPDVVVDSGGRPHVLVGSSYA